jgi:hypothetical protein
MKSIFINYGLLQVFVYFLKSPLYYNNSKNIQKLIKCDDNIYNIVMLSPTSVNHFHLITWPITNLKILQKLLCDNNGLSHSPQNI